MQILAFFLQNNTKIIQILALLSSNSRKNCKNSKFALQLENLHLKSPGVIVLRAGIAQVIQELTGKRTEIIDALKRDDLTASGGFPSVQNGLNLAMKNMEFLASYSTREVLIVYSSLFTQDPASLWDTMEAVSKKNIRVSVIGSAAEVHFFHLFLLLTQFLIKTQNNRLIF